MKLKSLENLSPGLNFPSKRLMSIEILTVQTIVGAWITQPADIGKAGLVFFAKNLRENKKGDRK